MANGPYGSNQSEPLGAQGYLSSLPQENQVLGSKRGPWRTVLVVAIIILVVSLGALGAIAYSYLQGQLKYDRLSEYANADGDAHGELAAMTVNWNELLAINPDTVAWVNIPDTNVDYPVVRGADNDYYLTHDFEGDEGWLANFGAVFMDYRNLPDWSDDAYFIYGHHMNDGSMFAAIAAMADQERFDASRIIYLLSPYGNFKLRSFSLIHCDPSDSLVQIAFSTPEEQARYVQDIMDRSIVEVGDVPDPHSIKKIFAFSTCDNLQSARYVLFAYIEETTVARLDDSTQKPASTGSDDNVKDKGASSGGRTTR